MSTCLAGEALTEWVILGLLVLMGLWTGEAANDPA